MKAFIYASGKQSEVEIEQTNGLSPSAYMKAQGYAVGLWLESDLFQITVGEREEAQDFMLFVSTAFSGGCYFLAQTLLDYAELVGKFNSATALTIPTEQPDWAE